MSETTENLEKVIELVQKNKRSSEFIGVGIAKNIDEANRTCDIEIDSELTLLECRLNAVIDDYANHILILPKEGSVVAYEAIDGKLTDVVVLAYGEIEAVKIVIEETSVEITKDGVVLNGGSVGATKTDVLVEKINNIEKNLNNILTVLKNITITLAPTGTIYFAPFFAAINNIVTSTQSELEDLKLKH